MQLLHTDFGKMKGHLLSLFAFYTSHKLRWGVWGFFRGVLSYTSHKLR